MFMVSEDLKVAVSTHHIPISKVTESITKDRIKQQVKVLNHCLKQDFSLQKPIVKKLLLFLLYNKQI